MNLDKLTEKLASEHVGQEIVREVRLRTAGEIRHIKDEGPKKALIGLEVDSKRTPRQGAPICAGGEQIGVITSGVSSPTLGKVVAMGFVPPRLTEPGTSLEIDLRGTKLPAKVVPLPFYKREKK